MNLTTTKTTQLKHETIKGKGKKVKQGEKKQTHIHGIPNDY